MVWVMFAYQPLYTRHIIFLDVSVAFTVNEAKRKYLQLFLCLPDAHTSGHYVASEDRRVPLSGPQNHR